MGDIVMSVFRYSLKAPTKHTLQSVFGEGNGLVPPVGYAFVVVGDKFVVVGDKYVVTKL